MKRVIGAVLASVLGMSWLPVTPARAVGETLAVMLTQVDGTAPFTSSPTPPAAGNDSGPSDRYVRTNDVLAFNVEISSSGGAASNVTFRLPLPKGTQLNAPPPYCGAGSSLTPATMPAPAVPTTVTSWQSLPTQTLVCNVGSHSNGETKTYPVSTVVRPEVPNGTALGTAASPVVVSVTSDGASTPVRSAEPVYGTVSARAQFDLSKNGVEEKANTGYYYQSAVSACPHDATRKCFSYIFPMTISAPAQGKGLTPLSPSFDFVDDLSPASLYGSGALQDPDYLAAADPLKKYGAVLIGCQVAGYGEPYSKIVTPAQDVQHSVRDSGTTTCTQSGPGQPVSVKVTNADTTAYTYPTYVSRPETQTISADRAYVYAYVIRVAVPVDAVADLGVSSTGTSTLNWSNTLKSFNATGIDGMPNLPAADRAFNDTRSASSVLSSSGSFNKFFVGVPGTPGNTSPDIFVPGWRVWEGPSSSTGTETGAGQLHAGGYTISNLQISNTSSSGTSNTYLLCDSWDNTKLQLARLNSPAGLSQQRVPANGRAVWVAGSEPSNGSTATTDAAVATSVSNLRIEYGTGVGSAAASRCLDADSPAGWVTDPATLPGNDPALAAQGIYTAVTRVRINATVVPGYYSIAIGMRAVPGLAHGTVLPNWTTGRQALGVSADLPTMLARRDPWNRSTYDPAANAGNVGDRLIVAGVSTRLRKEVWDPTTGAYTASGTPAYTGGQTVDYRLTVTATSGASGTSVPIVLEDCLPTAQTFVSSSVTPATVAVLGTQPAGSSLQCAAGETYVRWNLGPQPVNSTIAPLTYRTRMRSSASSGTYRNTALVSSTADVSAASVRTSAANVYLLQPSGISLEKTALTPVVEVNRAGEMNLAPLRWRVDLRLSATTPLSNPDIIDVLPRQGDGQTAYTGSLSFSAATVVSGSTASQPVVLLYTKAPLVDSDARAGTNTATGSTVWCTAPSGGSVASGAGDQTACPASAAEVTGVRVQRSGQYANGDVISVEVAMLPASNKAGDVYLNRAAARAEGQALLIGPVDAPETVVASSIGDLVWSDLNGNGRQDAGEPGIGGFPVRLTGTDGDGNAVTAQTTTRADGTYVFAGLQSGTYTVTFDPAGLGATQAFTTRATGDATLDSDGDPRTGATSPITLGPGEALTAIDQGVVTAGVGLAKQVCKVGSGCDPAVDGDWVESIEVLPGRDVQWRLSVQNTGSAVLRTATVSDAQLPGCQTTRTDPLAPGAVWRTTCTSPLTGDLAPNTATVTASADRGQVTATATATARAGTASLGDVVFYDVDGDGVRDAGEPGLGGATVTLTFTGDPADPRDDVILTTTTAADGSYAFTGLPAGPYTVSVTGLDPVLMPTADLDGTGTLATTAVTVAAGQSRTDVDFGFGLTFSLGDRVWLDLNGNGRLDAGEPAVPDGTTVELWDATTDTATGRTTTTSGGTYAFTGLPAGQYVVVIPASALTGQLAGAVAAPGEVADADGDVDGDNNALSGPGGSVRSGTITLGVTLTQTPGDQVSGGEPSGGGLVNQTLDLGLLGAAAIRAVKEVCTTGSCDPAAPAGSSGWAETVQVGFLADVTWRVVVTNTGLQNLTGVNVDDDQASGCSQPVGALAVGETRAVTCVSSRVVAGFTNTATAAGSGPAGALPLDRDTASVTVPAATAGLQLKKLVVTAVAAEAPTAPGVLLGEGRTASFRYEVSLAPGAQVPVSGVAVTDDNGTPADPADDLRGTYTSGDTDGDGVLAAGETWVFTSPTVAFTTPGQYTNTATSSGHPVNDTSATVSATAVANVFVVDASVTLTKLTNGVDVASGAGPAVLAGDTVTWTYRVTNTGNVPLAAARVTDDQGVSVTCGQADANGDGAIDLLAVGASVECRGSGPAVAGAYENTGTVTGTPASATGSPLVDAYGTPLPAVSASDRSAYTGVTAGVSISKLTQGTDNPAEPGVVVATGGPVRWTFTVTNTGTTALTGVQVSDGQVPGIDCGAGTASVPLLVPGQSVECVATGVAAAGQHTNTASVAGTPAVPLDGMVPGTWPADAGAYKALTRADGSAVAPATASDIDHYVGVSAGASLVKLVAGDDANAAPGPVLRPGSPTTWTYRVTNTGSTALAQVQVTDDRGLQVSCPAGVLLPGATLACTAQGPAPVGAYVNTGTATGQPVLPLPAVGVVLGDVSTWPADAAAYGPAVATGPEGTTSPVPAPSASDVAHAFGAQPGLSLTKDVCVDGAGCDPVRDADWGATTTVRAGQAVTFRVVVTNTGNVTLGQVVVTDAQVPSCSQTLATLAPGESARIVCQTVPTGSLQNRADAVGTVLGADGAPLLYADGTAVAQATAVASAAVVVTPVPPPPTPTPSPAPTTPAPTAPAPTTLVPSPAPTRSPAPSPLAETGASALLVPAGVAGVVLVAAGVLLVARRRRQG